MLALCRPPLVALSLLKADLDGHLYCSDCNCDTDEVTHCCARCGGPLGYRYTIRPTFPQDQIQQRPANMWRYAEALPSFEQRVSLGEAISPLLPVQCGDMPILVKCDHTLTTGSYKDRGAALLISYLRQQGVAEAVEDSSGNAGASMAAYAARAGMALKVYCPASASPEKLLQIRLHDAELVRIGGPRNCTTEAVIDYVKASGTCYASHLWHPLFIEGVKTAAFEIAEQLNWTAPDTIVCPVGAGSILLGMYRGFSDLLAAGATKRMPQLVAIQAKQISPIFEAFHAGADRITPATQIQPTLAEGIALPAPLRDVEVLKALRSTRGTVIAVEEEEIIDGVKALGKVGLTVEPTSAVIWHGLQRLRQDGLLTPDQKVVAILSGNGLKAAQRISEMLD